jgi:hypothetical protein
MSFTRHLGINGLFAGTRWLATPENAEMIATLAELFSA